MKLEIPSSMGPRVGSGMSSAMVFSSPERVRTRMNTIIRLFDDAVTFGLSAFIMLMGYVGSREFPDNYNSDL
ncbi:hypothetical protein HFX_0567 [Haloferax mediterranei ATCC 33500]|uniref:Uncharacterized protein n=1 Tax=Haloferax mediterranei (strain ATCC 33500 / DSM 1411 / JCM 8866 / NBRC 14739 / NCIMB 2177 / R-4) TaxID=523841 RepID=I3R231_HALMT|nr:hypothetical protein HFX_0567 [Haloferax mediterranei ATCC 33500]